MRFTSLSIQRAELTPEFDGVAPLGKRESFSIIGFGYGALRQNGSVQDEVYNIFKA
jgi:hypothetical protein